MERIYINRKLVRLFTVAIVLLCFGIERSHGQSVLAKKIEINQVVPDKQNGVIRLFFNAPSDFNPDQVEAFKMSVRLEEMIGAKEAGRGGSSAIDPATMVIKSVSEDGSSISTQTGSKFEKNIIIVFLDHSGSMKENDLSQAFEALSRIIEMAKQTGSSLYFNAFDTYIRELYQLIQGTANASVRFTNISNNNGLTFEELKGKYIGVNNDEDENDTDLLGAFYTANAYLNVQTTKGDNQGSIIQKEVAEFKGKKILIVLSDGAHDLDNFYYSDYDEKEYYYYHDVVSLDKKLEKNNILELIKLLDPSVSIYPVAYREKSDKSFLNKVCEASPNENDRVFEADLNGLEDVFKKIVKEARSKFMLEYVPQEKLFKGEKREVRLSATVDEYQFSKEDNKITYSYGSEFEYVEFPSGKSDTAASTNMLAYLLPVGIFAVLFLLTLFVFPLIYTSQFKARYIVSYSGPADGSVVCPVCSQSFQRGDKVVTKCSHHTHLECWNENDRHQCMYYSMGKCKEGKELVNGTFDLLKNPFKIEAFGNGIFGALGGLVAGYITLIFSDKFRKMFGFDQANEWLSISVPAFLMGFFIAGFILFYIRKGQMAPGTFFKVVFTGAVISGVTAAVLAVFLQKIANDLFNFPFIGSLIIWVPFGALLGFISGYIGDMNIKNAVIGGLAGGVAGAIISELLPLLIPDGYKSSAVVVSKMALGGIMPLLIVLVVKRLEDCWLRVTSANYGSNKPLYIGKWLKDGEVLIGSSGKESQVTLFFDRSGLISEKHFKIKDTGKGYTIENISTWGELLVAGRPVNHQLSVPLRNGDTISLGESILVFEIKDKQLSNNKN